MLKSTLVYGTLDECAWQQSATPCDTTDEVKLDSFEHRVARLILRTDWRNSITNETTRQRFHGNDVPPLSYIIKQYRLRRLGHVFGVNTSSYPALLHHCERKRIAGNTVDNMTPTESGGLSTLHNRQNLTHSRQFTPVDRRLCGGAVRYATASWAYSEA